MQNYAIVNKKTNVVVNVAQWCGKSQWKPPKGFIAIKSKTAGTGDVYNPKTGKFKRPAPQVNETAPSQEERIAQLEQQLAELTKKKG